MTRISFDTDRIVQQLRAQQEATLAMALELATDDDIRASILAQASLFPALEQCHISLIGMREAERPPGFVAMVFGIFAGQVLNAILMNIDDRETVLQAYFEAMSHALSGKGLVKSEPISVTGQPAGTA